MSLIETTDCQIRVPVTETPWAWVCPRKRSTIGAERCKQMQQQDKCKCDNAAKAPTEKEMKRAREHKPYSYKPADKKKKYSACCYAKTRSEKMPCCPLEYSKTQVERWIVECKYRKIMPAFNNLSICLYKARKEGVSHKIR